MSHLNDPPLHQLLTADPGKHRRRRRPGPAGPSWGELDDLPPRSRRPGTEQEQPSSTPAVTPDLDRP